jgi:hypothetical protein
VLRDHHEAGTNDTLITQNPERERRTGHGVGLRSTGEHCPQRTVARFVPRRTCLHSKCGLYEPRVSDARTRPTNIAMHDADLDHDRFPPFHFAGVSRPYFAGSSLILSPPFATGMTQIGVATSAELRSDV